MALDDTSRVAYAQVLPDEQGDSVTAFLRAAGAYYAGLGVRIREVLTDNGGGYRSQLFAQAGRDLALRHRFTRPCTPRANGNAERFFQTALREWAYARACARSVHRLPDLPRGCAATTGSGSMPHRPRSRPWAESDSAGIIC